MKIIDITRPIYQGMAVYPGSPETVFEQVGQLPKDRSVSTKITIGSHAGTHVDAPNHVIGGTGGVDSYPLGRFMGEAAVLDLTHVESVITDKVISTPPMAGEKSRNSGISRYARDDLIILLKTKNSSMDWSIFHENFVALDESAARYLISLKPKLIGIDGPSIKKFRVPDQTHQIILSENIPIIEWLDFSKVKAGTYQFIGFPLFLKGLDGSSLRAVLIY